MRYDDGLDYGTEILSAGHAVAKVYNDPPHHLADVYAVAQATLKQGGCDTPPPVVAPPSDDNDDHGDNVHADITEANDDRAASDSSSGGGSGIDAAPGDLDCSDISGSIRVSPGDPDRLDRDSDGIGCES